MTKKHFEAIAAIIHQANIFDTDPAAGFDEGYSVGIEDCASLIAESMADYFAKENPSFDRKRFLKACGM